MAGSGLGPPGAPAAASGSQRPDKTYCFRRPATPRHARPCSAASPPIRHDPTASHPTPHLTPLHATAPPTPPYRTRPHPSHSGPTPSGPTPPHPLQPHPTPHPTTGPSSTSWGLPQSWLIHLRPRAGMSWRGLAWRKLYTAAKLTPVFPRLQTRASPCHPGRWRRRSPCTAARTGPWSCPASPRGTPRPPPGKHLYPPLQATKKHFSLFSPDLYTSLN